MKLCLPVLHLFSLSIICTAAFAQDSTQSCKVSVVDLAGKYTGECKNGYANGKGEAVGLNRYTGSFKNGLPHGAGIYYYGDSNYYSGNFQDGIKEGKGEYHYLKNGLPDSVVKGFWSADEFRGKTYVTYKFGGTQYFENVEVTPSKDAGNMLKIEITTTSGTPDGVSGNRGLVLKLADLIPTNGVFASQTSNMASTSKTTVTYTVSKFPAHFFVSLSNGERFNLELYKAANWTIRLFKNS